MREVTFLYALLDTRWMFKYRPRKNRPKLSLGRPSRSKATRWYASSTAAARAWCMKHSNDPRSARWPSRSCWPAPTRPSRHDEGDPKRRMPRLHRRDQSDTGGRSVAGMLGPAMIHDIAQCAQPFAPPQRFPPIVDFQPLAQRLQRSFNPPNGGRHGHRR